MRIENETECPVKCQSASKKIGVFAECSSSRTARNYREEERLSVRTHSCDRRIRGMCSSVLSEVPGVEVMLAITRHSQVKPISIRVRMHIRIYKRVL